MAPAQREHPADRNEYYSFIRPKRVARSGERPTKALLRAGVEYVEVRALDVSAFDPVGVNQNKLRFLEVFLAMCLMKDSPPIATWEHEVLDSNHVTVARRGREPGLTLQRDGRPVPLQAWARELVDSMRGIAEVFDHGDLARPYQAALAVQAAKIQDVSLTPSARMLAELENTGESFFDLALRMSRLHKEYFMALHSPNVDRQSEFKSSLRSPWRAGLGGSADRISLNNIWPIQRALRTGRTSKVLTYQKILPVEPIFNNPGTRIPDQKTSSPTVQGST